MTCSIHHLPDILPGVDAKHCECLVDPRDEANQNFNPGMMPIALSEGMLTPVASCDIFRDGADQGPWGAALWQASEAFCDPAWGDGKTP